ncbi:MAG: hypothetical protein AAF638_07105 [Pseudomonadota bacterium]
MDVNDPGWKPENWHKERKPLTALWRRANLPVRKLLYADEVRRLATQNNRFRGERVVLVGNAPSLAKLDLNRLAGTMVCVVNRGLRAMDEGILPRADIHMMSSTPGYIEFRDEVEVQCIRHQVPLRFYRHKLKPHWQALVEKGARPFFPLRRAGTMTTTGFQTNALDGIGSDGTILLFASQILYFLGFQEVAVIGCDLEYDPANKYFYQMTDKDRAHEEDPETIAARASLVRVNAQFEIARRAFEADGRRLLNAGAGGNLNALERVDFNTFFQAA